MTFSTEMLEAGHAHCACHRSEIEKSNLCGCFHCAETFSASEIRDWFKETSGEYSRAPDPWTALCPKCGIDAVIGDSSALPVDNQQFLFAMQEHWFGQAV